MEISSKCKYIKLAILDKEHSKAASLDLFRVYGHPYFKYHEDKLSYTQKRDKVEETLMQYGYNTHGDWDVDE